MIHIIGLGPSNEGNIREKIKKYLLNAKDKKVIVRTKEHPAISFLENNGINYDTCDDFYMQNDNFQQTYEDIANYVLTESKLADVYYLVPGHPMVAELTTKIIIEKEPNTIVVGGESFIDSCINLSKFDPVEGFQLADATNIDTLKNINPKNHILITQCYDDFTAANISVELDVYYPYDYEIFILENVGLDSEKKYKSSLSELSNTVGDNINNLRTIYIPAQKDTIESNIKNLLPKAIFSDNKDTDFLVNEIERSIKKIKNIKGDEKKYIVEEELANMIYNILDFENASDEYYEVNNILKNLANKVESNG